MIHEAFNHIKFHRDRAENAKRWEEAHTLSEILRLIDRSSTANARNIAVKWERIVAHVQAGNYAHTQRDIKALCQRA